MRRTYDLPVEKLLDAVEQIAQGKCKRVDVSDGCKVYEVKNVIRIDLKLREE